MNEYIHAFRHEYIHTYNECIRQIKMFGDLISINHRHAANMKMPLQMLFLQSVRS